MAPENIRKNYVSTRQRFDICTWNDKRNGEYSFLDHFTPAEKKRRPYYTLRIRRRYERKGECSFRDLFTPAEKEDDGYLR